MTPTWELKQLGDVSVINYGYTESASPEPIGPRFLRITDIQDDHVDWESVPYCKIEASDIPKYQLATGDIVFARTGATTGKSFLVADPPHAVFASYLIRLRLLDKNLLPEFVSLFFQTVGYWQSIKDGSTGSAQGGFNATKLGALSIPIPPLPEQKRIVAILKEAFVGMATAKANTEKNLQNASILFESHLESAFSQRQTVSDGTTARKTNTKFSTKSVPLLIAHSDVVDMETSRLNSGRVTRTRGRAATLRHIAGKSSLSVGMPGTGARKGWHWSALTDVARLESGHTPSRRHPEYWGGSIPWIGIRDARQNHGKRITDTIQTTNELGIANSAARVLPENTVCLSRTASVGYVVVMGRPMATSQDFVNWVCSNELNPDFLKYLILAEGRSGLLRYASGSVHQTIYFPEVKAFYICYPDPNEQARIVRQCDALQAQTERLVSLFERKIVALDALKKSLLEQAFAGQLAPQSAEFTLTPPTTKKATVTPIDQHAGILATAYQMHVKHGNEKDFGRVKAEKIAHLIEAHVGINLGRSPIKDAAGPNDHPHLIRMLHRAKMAGYFSFEQTDGPAYHVTKYRKFNSLVERTNEALGTRKPEVESLLKLLLPLNTGHAEVVATVYAAWNNLLLDGQTVTDESIVVEAREKWHPDKLRIPRENFLKAIQWMRKKNLVPAGNGKRVLSKEEQI